MSWALGVAGVGNLSAFLALSDLSAFDTRCGRTARLRGSPRRTATADKIWAPKAGFELLCNAQAKCTGFAIGLDHHRPLSSS